MTAGVGRADELNSVTDYLQQTVLNDRANRLLGVSTIAAFARCRSAHHHGGRLRERANLRAEDRADP